MDIAFPIISECIGNQISNNILYPEINPLSYRCIGSYKYIVLISIFCFIDPISFFRQCLEVLFMLLSGFVGKSGLYNLSFLW